jgi:large subunit ribosomal protein L23
MKAIKDTIVSPYLTEKTSASRLKANQYGFKVNVDATKSQIKKAIETRFQVIVLSVNTVSNIGKLVRTRGIEGRRPNWKKAIVRLKEGDVIKELE